MSEDRAESGTRSEPKRRLPAWPQSVWYGVFAVVLIGAFLLPQEVPLEWYPLNEPGTDINYLEFKCAADKDGEVRIHYDVTNGFNEIDSIRIPISPTEQTYTYTFPLLDGPMVGMRLHGVAGGGTLKVHHFRIINRREELMRSFGRESFTPLQQIASIAATEDGGWVIKSTAEATDPVARVELYSPVVPVGMNHRNLLRCLLSTGYLAMMLSILMLAVVTAFWKPSSWRNFLLRVGTIVALSVPLSALGNRGLIRNSIHYAQFEPPAGERLRLEIDVETTAPNIAQVFWDLGRGFREEHSAYTTYLLEPGRQTVRFLLPRGPLRGLRFDPHHYEGSTKISNIRLTDEERRVRAEIPVSGLLPQHHVGSAQMENGELLIETTPGGDDPFLVFSAEAVAEINRAMRPR